MKVAYHIGRILFGAWFLYAGIEFFLPFDLQPIGENPLTQEFTLALIHSGFMTWVKIAEILIGVLVLLNRAMPFAMAATAPITFVIGYWNFILEPGLVEYAFGIATVVLNIFLLWPYRRYWLPMVVWKAAPDFSMSIKSNDA